MLFRIIRQPTPTFLQDYVGRIALISATDQPTFEQVLSSSIRRVSSGDNKELLGKPTSITRSNKDDFIHQTSHWYESGVRFIRATVLRRSAVYWKGIWKTFHRGWTQICSSSPQKYVCRSIYHPNVLSSTVLMSLCSFIGLLCSVAWLRTTFGSNLVLIMDSLS